MKCEIVAGGETVRGAGDYTLRSRTIDEKGIPQPLPRPFRKSGHLAIEAVSIRVKG